MSYSFTFDEAAHEYRLNGARLPSVTQIIKAAGIGPDFGAVPPDVLEAKRALGTAVHAACELDDLGELDDEATDAAVMGYVRGWRAFRSALDVQVLMNEQRLYHPSLCFAGTLDRVVNMATRGSRDGGALWLLDLKTGDDAHPSYGVQLAAYQLLLSARGMYLQADGFAGSVLRRGTVHLRADGTYRMHEHRNHSDEAAFRAALAIYQWKENNK